MKLSPSAGIRNALTYLSNPLNSRKALLPAAAAHTATAHTAATMPPAAPVRHILGSSLTVSKPTWWLESRFHFSFADYYNPKNMNFGALRVLNDDLVKPKAGFGAHPHRDAEIFSYIVTGELAHKDSMGNYESLPRGCVQYMSAGTGVVHSEMNDGDKTCRFLQIWLTPDQRGHDPQYGSATYEAADRHNRLLHMLGGTGAVPSWPTIQKGRCINLHQDANVFVSESDPGVQHDITLAAGRQAYLVCIEGSLSVGTSDAETVLKQRDAAELVADKKPVYLSLKAGEQGTHFMLIELKIG